MWSKEEKPPVSYWQHGLASKNMNYSAFLHPLPIIHRWCLWCSLSKFLVKGTIADWNWLRVRLLDRFMLGEELLRVLNIFLFAYDFYIKKYKKVASRKMDRNWLDFVNSWLGNVLTDGCWELLKGYICIKKQLENAQRLLDSLWAILKGRWRATGKCLNNTCQPIGEKAELQSSNRQKRGNFHPFSPKRRVSVYIFF